jgi:hypothetical protein
MSTCFVIQPFDRGPFDKRYEDVLEPAIRNADLEPYRVDRDPRASIPIEQIESGIRDAVVCLADITADNPNIWFELGYAIASGKPVVLVSAASRQRFPFDVQHRNIITYNTDSSSDFSALGDSITLRLRAELAKEERIGRAAQLSTPLAAVEGLRSHEVVALVTVAENISHPNDSVSTHMIRQDMSRAGYRPIAVTLGLAALLEKRLLAMQEVTDLDGEQYTLYSVTGEGLQWLQANQDKLILEAPPPAPPADDGLPF